MIASQAVDRRGTKAERDEIRGRGAPTSFGSVVCV